MEEQDLNNGNDDPPAPPQPPQFSTCSAPPGSSEWFAYWANEARETFDYNRRIAEYGREMAVWSRRKAGLSVENEETEMEKMVEPPATTETQTVNDQEEKFTSSDSLKKRLPGAGTQTTRLLKRNESIITLPTLVTLDTDDICKNVRMLNNNPYLDVFNELTDFPFEDFPETSDDPTIENEIPERKSDFNIFSFLHKSEDSKLKNKSSNKLLSGNNFSLIRENKAIVLDTNETETNVSLQELENHSQVEGSTPFKFLKENMETRVTEVVKTIFNGLGGIIFRIKDGVHGILDDMKVDYQKRLEKQRIDDMKRVLETTSLENQLDFHESYLNDNWRDAEEHSVVSDEREEFFDSSLGTDYHPEQKSNRIDTSAIVDQGKPVDSQKKTVFKASMELGAFEINTWKESSNSSSQPGIRSNGGTTCRILCFSFKRVTTKEGTRLIFDKSTVDEDSLKIIPRSSEDRHLLEVTANRKGNFEELNIFLPVNTIFSSIKIDDSSTKYLSVSIPFGNPASESNQRSRTTNLLKDQ